MYIFGSVRLHTVAPCYEECNCVAYMYTTNSSLHAHAYIHECINSTCKRTPCSAHCNVTLDTYKPGEFVENDFGRTMVRSLSGEIVFVSARMKLLRIVCVTCRVFFPACLFSVSLFREAEKRQKSTVSNGYLQKRAQTTDG